MAPALNLNGHKNGKLTVLGRTERDKWGAWMWKCRCDCGTVWETRGSNILAYDLSSCYSCTVSEAKTRHGMTGTSFYQRWRCMLDRVTNPNFEDWHNYGGRGITVCEEWLIFENFYEDMWPTFKEDMELDRKDNNGNYNKDNCRWATRVEQQNNRRNNHTVEYGGISMTVKEWSDKTGIKPNTLIYRLRRGWPVDRALTEPTNAKAA